MSVVDYMVIDNKGFSNPEPNTDSDTGSECVGNFGVFRSTVHFSP